MLINDFFRMMHRIIKENKLLFNLWMILQLISFCLILWTLYNYLDMNQCIWQYKTMLQWNLKETIHVEIRIPGIMPEDSYIEDAKQFIEDCNNDKIINKIGVFSHYNDFCDDFPYQQVSQELSEDGLLDFFCLDSGCQDLCDLKINEIDEEYITENPNKIPILAGSDYKEAKIGDCFHGAKDEYIVVGTLKENAEWFSNHPMQSKDGNIPLNSMLVVLLPYQMPVNNLANGFNNIYINCEKKSLKEVKEQIMKLLSNNGLIGIVETADEVIDNYITNAKEDFDFVRNIAIMCMFITVLSGIAIQFLIVQKQKYSLAVYFINGLKQKYIIAVFGMIDIIINVFVYLLSSLICKMLIIIFQEYDPYIYIYQTMVFGFVPCILEMVILIMVTCQIIYRLQYRDIIQ